MSHLLEDEKMTGRMMNTVVSRNGFGLAPELTRWLDHAMEVPTWSQGEVQEHDDHGVITIDVPGVAPEQVAVTAADRVLEVRAERDGRTAIVRRFNVGPKYDLAQVTAQLALGVLRLTLPKAAEAKPRQIAITAG